MYSFIEKSDCHVMRNQRGTAIIETLMVFFPFLLFFVMITQVLYYWEEKHIDRSIQMETEVARHNLTSVALDQGRQYNLSNPLHKDGYQFYMKDISGGTKNLPHWNVYITDYISDKKYRKLLVGRGTNSWLSFLWLRGQYFGKEEKGRRVKWFEDAGNKKLNDLRKPLLLGS